MNPKPDVDSRISEGVLEVARKAKESGKARFIINNVMPTLVERNMGILAMKSLSNGGFFGGTCHFYGGDNPRIVPNIATVEEAIHFVWSLPVSVLITGPDHSDMLREKIGLAKSFKQMTEADRMALVERVGNAGLDGSKVEFYKA